MPELAESFIIARQLAQVFSVPFSSDSGLQLPGELALPWLLDPQRVTFLPLDKVYAHLAKLTVDVVSVNHRGKLISIEVKKKTGALSYLLVMLGMTGRFSISPTPHDRVRIASKTGGRIFYTDIRKFGRIAVDESHVPFKPSITSMINPSLVLELVKSSPSLSIKLALVNQRIAFSGLGSYMSNELMFRCGLHPFDPVSVLDEQDVDAILKSARDLATRSVASGGCTLKDFRDMANRPGKFQDQLLIHGRETCPTCKREVLRRSNPTTHFCQRCQPTRIS